MVGLFQAIFIKESIAHRIGHCQVNTTKTGLGGILVSNNIRITW